MKRILKTAGTSNFKEESYYEYLNLDTLESFKELSNVKKVNLVEAMTGENGAERVKKYSVPMAAGLAYNYAAKQVDDEVLEGLKKLAKEAQLTEKYAALYNGEMINTGEKRLVLHQLTRGQLGDTVTADGVDKRAFYVEQQQKIADFAIKYMQVRLQTQQEKNSQLLFRSVSAEVTLVRVQCTLHLRTGQRKMTNLKWKPDSSAM